ncbi:MAG: polysaccharide pyruvyl transferase family protein [Paludibacteraceae bacterium]|nr:polysaccharide pyruvyl transferase family protein [Paludibacteraceae bacterium]
MKVSIITILDNQNIGTYLQAYALSSVLRKMGHSCEYIDYRRKSESSSFIFFDKMKDSESSLFKRIASAVYRSISVSIERRKLSSFFRKRTSITSLSYTSNEELKTNVPIADVYMTGSDQVWNSVYNRGIDKAFYLDFVPSGKKKMSYAASIGMDAIPVAEKEEVKQLLAKYDAISVRESQAKDLLEDINIDSEVVLDPTLLLNSQEWSEIADESKFEKNEPYVLVYSVNDNQKHLVEEVVKKISDYKKVKIYQISSDWFRSRLSCCDRFYSMAEPQLFLKLIKDADYVVVSSFHGTAFSLNMNKNFVSVVPDKYNSRVKNLLSMFGLDNRIVSNNDFDVSIIDELMDFQKVNEKLEYYRCESSAFLRDNLV